MPNLILAGPAGSGKTTRILEELVESLQSARDPLADDCFLILPSAEHSERIIALLTQQGVPGFFHRRVTTLNRLILETFGVGEENLLSEATRFFIVRDILQARPWKYFQRVQQLAGFASLASDFLNELKEGLVSAADFRERMNALKKKQPELAVKYEDLAGIYEAYQERLKQDKFYDRQDLLAIFREKRKSVSAGKRFRKIWLDGFFDFTPLQAEYLRELSGLSESMTVALTCEGKPARHALFEPLAATRQLLESMGFKTEVMPDKNHRTAAPALAHLENNLFRETLPKALPPAAEALAIFDAVGMQGEAEMIAREIMRLYRQGGYRFSDFAILLRQIGAYESVLRPVLGRYGIPFEIHERERLKLSPLAQAAALLLKVFRDGWKREDLFNLLKSSYVMRLGQEERDYAWIGELEHQALRLGIRQSREEWLREWNDVSPETHERKLKCLSVLAGIEDRLRNAPDFDAMSREFRRALFNELGVRAGHEGDDLAVRREAAGLRRLEGVLEEMRVHLRLGGGGVDFIRFADNFLRIVELDLFPLHHRDRNRVQIYGVSLARQKEYRVVFVAGLLEKQFPVQIRENALLSDWERRLFNGPSESRLLERLPRQQVERYLFYLAVTRASERLILTYPRLDREGKESLPSFYVDEVQRLFSSPLNAKSQALARPWPAPAEAASRRELECAVMGEIWQPARGTDPALLYLTNRILEDPAARVRFREAFMSQEAQLLDPSVLKEAAFQVPKTSATKLEEYAACGYKYFVSRALELRDPEEEINFKQQGSILHEVLEKFFSAWSQGFRPDPRGGLVKFVREAMPAALKKFPLRPAKKYGEDLMLAAIEETLVRFLEKEIERLKGAALQPAYFEFNFSAEPGANAPLLEIDSQSGKILVSGKIDRIDTDKEKKFGLVMDYKRTKASAKIDEESLALGTSLQLPIYITAMRKFLGLEAVGGELFIINDRKSTGFYHDEPAAAFLEKRKGLPKEDFEKLIERSLGHVRKIVEDIRQAKIPVRPRVKDVCSRMCSYGAICRIEKWRAPIILEEIRQEMLGPAEARPEAAKKPKAPKKSKAAK